MASSNEKVHELDYKKAQKHLEDYRQATGVDCFIIDSQGYPLDSTDKKVGGVCHLCGKTQGGENFKTCRELHLYGAYQAERFGGRYMYFCETSMLHWATPIIIDGMMQGALIGGPVLIIPAEEVIEELNKKKKFSPDQIQQLKKDLKTIPQVSPRKAEALLEMLYFVSLGLSDSDSAQVQQDEQNRQQAKIGEYIHYLKSMGGDESTFETYPLEKEKALQARIIKGDRLGAQEVLNEILGTILYTSGNDLDVMKARILELTVLLSRAALEGGADIEKIFGLNYKYLNQIHHFTSLEELAVWLSRILNRFCDFVFAFKDIKHSDVMYKSFEYIQRNLSEKITLDEVAAHVNLSPTYFSKIFKEEMGSSFSAYVNEQRVDKSKELLANSTLTLVDIAGIVGYEDQSYFNKVFKKQTGLSPGKYREKRSKRFEENPEIHE